MTDSNLITVNEVGQYLPEVDTGRFTAPTVSGIISQASKKVTDYLEYSPLAENIVGETKNGYVTNEGDLLIFPDKIPVQSVTSIAIVKGTTSLSLNITDSSGNAKYNIDHTQRKIRYPYGEIVLTGVPIFTDFRALRGYQFYTKISYRGGFEANALPDTIKRACIAYVKHILSTQYNVMGAQSMSQGNISFNFSGKEGKSNFEKEAESLLAPYRNVL